MKPITETQLSILEQLNEYRFLTVQQMHRIGISKQKQTIYKALKYLSDGKKPLVFFSDFGTFPTIGRLSRMYYLSKYGAVLLAKALRCDSDGIHYPKGVKLFTRDYFHRIETIDLHILARTFCELHSGSVEFNFFQAYFEHKGANHCKDETKLKRQAIGKIEIDENTSIIPDCIFQMTTKKGDQKWLYMGEIYRGHTTKRVHQQLDRYLTALEKGSINKAYDFFRPIPVLIICETERSMVSLMNRLKKDTAFSQAEKYFLFRVIEPVTMNKTKIKQTTKEVYRGFYAGWKTYTGREVRLFMG